MSAAAARDDAAPRINLSRANVLLVDTSHHGLTLMSQMVSGFGVRHAHKCVSAAAAEERLNGEPYDLVICEAGLAGPVDGYDLVRRLRRASRSPNQQTASILLCGHSRMSEVRKARDCGVNLIIAKPVAPQVVLQRILWVARDPRDFVDCGDIYVGPDRRFKIQPPGARPSRRHGDDAAPVSEPAGASA